MDVCDIFISCLVSCSDGTHSLCGSFSANCHCWVNYCFNMIWWYQMPVCGFKQHNSCCTAEITTSGTDLLQMVAADIMLKIQWIVEHVYWQLLDSFWLFDWNVCVIGKTIHILRMHSYFWLLINPVKKSQKIKSSWRWSYRDKFNGTK